MKTRVNANHYVLQLARTVIDAADRLDLSPEVLIERLDSLNSLDSFALFEASTDMEKNNQDNIALDDSFSSLEESVSESVPPSHMLFEKMDRQFEQMSLQQLSLDNMTRAIGDLVLTLSSQTQSSPISQTVESPTPKQKNKSTQSLPKPSSEVSGRKLYSIQIRQKINQYIDAIMAFNDTLHQPHGEKFAISVAGLKRLAGCGQHPVYAVYNNRKPEIDEHHRKHQLSSTHNKKDNSFLPIEEVISL